MQYVPGPKFSGNISQNHAIEFTLGHAGNIDQDGERLSHRVCCHSLCIFLLRLDYGMNFSLVAKKKRNNNNNNKRTRISHVYSAKQSSLSLLYIWLTTLSSIFPSIDITTWLPIDKHIQFKILPWKILSSSSQGVLEELVIDHLAFMNLSLESTTHFHQIIFQSLYF